MARKVLVRLVDDLDGLPSEDVATVTFSLDRVDYQIDLNESNASKLREGLADFVTAARRTGGRIKRGAGASARAAANDGPAIREWAREQGHQLAERGRIPSHIVDEYRAATGKGRGAKVTRIETAEKPARAPRKPAAKTAAASRSAASTTATTATRRTRAAAAKPAATTGKAAAKTTKATPAKAAEKTAKTTTAKTAKTPRATASTAAKGGQRAARRAPAKSR